MSYLLFVLCECSFFRYEEMSKIKNPTESKNTVQPVEILLLFSDKRKVKMNVFRMFEEFN